MDPYDVIVVGAGPAGLECARQIAQAGRSVLVLERFGSFSKNNFSSAGVTLETLSRFDLPHDIVGSFWNKFTLVSTHASHTWRSRDDLGCVLDFSKLRLFLSREVERSGGEVRMGHRFSSLRPGADGGNVIEAQDLVSGKRLEFGARFVVDGTGPLRAVMEQVAALPEDLEDSFGLEYVIEVPERDYRPGELIFLLGARWMPDGYSWVFPMGPNRLKVGSGYWIQKGKAPGPLHRYVEAVIKDYLKIEDLKILEKHGGRLRYSAGQKDVYARGPVVSVGDAISAVNPLGGEGIRHGMQSGRVAAEVILKKIASKAQDLGAYERAMKEYFGLKWKRSHYAAFLCYHQLQDPHLDIGIKMASVLPTQQIFDILFNYNFGKGILSSVIKRFKVRV